MLEPILRRFCWKMSFDCQINLVLLSASLAKHDHKMQWFCVSSIINCKCIKNDGGEWNKQNLLLCAVVSRLESLLVLIVTVAIAITMASVCMSVCEYVCMYVCDTFLVN